MTFKSVIKRIKEDYFDFPMYIVANPFKGFDELKYENKGKLSVAFTFLALLCLINIISEVYSGFIVNYSNPYVMNSLYIVVTTSLPILLFVTANWSVTTLMDGIGKYKEIFLVNMYALYLTLFCNAIFVILSNVLTVDEIPLAYFFTGLSTVTYCFYLFIGLIVVHNFTFSKAIGSILLTFVSMAIIIFIAMLLMSLIGEVITFFITIYRELSLRFL